MTKVTAALDAAHRVPDTRIFIRERPAGETAQDGRLNPAGPRPVRFLEAPPGIPIEPKRTLVKDIGDAVTDAYAARDALIFLREYPLDMVSQDGGLQSENPMILEVLRQAAASR